MNITKELKYLFENLCLLVAFCMPTSLLAVEVVTFEPECVAMKNTAPTGSIVLAAANNDVHFKVENAKEQTEYRLYDSGSNFMNTSQTVTLNVSSTSVNTYEADAQIYYYANSSNKNYDHIVRKFVLQYKENNTWVDVPNVDPIEVHNCYVTNDSYTTNRNDVKVVLTLDDACRITGDQLTEALTAKGALPEVKNVNGASVCYNPYYFVAGSEYNNKNVCVDNAIFSSEQFHTEDIRVIFKDAAGSLLDAGTYNYPNLYVHSCPVFDSPTFTLSNSCEAHISDIETLLNCSNGASKTFTLCNQSATGVLSLPSDPYEPGTYTANWTISNDYVCPQTFKVESPSLVCTPPSNIVVGITDGCMKEVELALPDVSNLCGNISIAYSRNGTTFKEVNSSVAEEFYANTNPYTITWRLTDGAETVTCTSTVTVNYMDCSDYTFVSNSKHVEFALPTIGGCGDTGGTLSASLNSQTLDTSNNKVSVDLPNYGAYDVVIKATQNNSSSILKTCTSHILLLKPTNVCK